MKSVTHLVESGMKSYLVKMNEVYFKISDYGLYL